MNVRPFQAKMPRIADSAYIDPTAVVIGDVTVGEDSSFWPMAVARGDVHFIRIGDRTSIQDGCVLHVTHDSEFAPGGAPLIVGSDVTVGHRVVLHACTVGNLCLIGMSASIMDGAVVGERSIIGAGTLVPPGKELEGGFLYRGSPAEQVRPLTADEHRYLEYAARHYAALKDRYRAGISG